MKRITIISGHYGSGKSECSINLAIHHRVSMVVDLDIINPYFRSREQEKLLATYGIEMIASPLENALGSDLPYISKKIYLPLYDTSKTAIYDLGGSVSGARLVRQITDYLTNDYDHLLCVNIYRDETKDEASIIQTIHAIEGSSGIKVTGFIHNSHLLRETTIEDVVVGQKILRKVAKKMQLPIVYTCIFEDVDLKNKQFDGEMILMKLYLRNLWL